MTATRIAHGLFVLALSSIFIFACYVSWIGWQRMEYHFDPCPYHQDEYRELERLAPKVHAFFQKEGRLPIEKEIFLLTEDKTIVAHINGSESDFEIFVTSGHDPKPTFEERGRFFGMGLDGPYSHYTSRDDSITCHAW